MKKKMIIGKRGVHVHRQAAYVPWEQRHRDVGLEGHVKDERLTEPSKRSEKVTHENSEQDSKM